MLVKHYLLQLGSEQLAYGPVLFKLVPAVVGYGQLERGEGEGGHLGVQIMCGRTR